jgi:hypothetical protein
MSGTRDVDEQQLREQAAAAMKQAEALSQRSAELAGQIADTETEVARVHDLIAENDTTSLGTRHTRLPLERVDRRPGAQASDRSRAGSVGAGWDHPHHLPTEINAGQRPRSGTVQRSYGPLTSPSSHNEN